jgi:CheY-like chemotaxis protein
LKAFEGKKFLVVDDDEMLREVFNELFTAEGAQVTEAQNGIIAFSLVEKNKFDVVFSDIRMPGGDGIALATKISEMTGHKPLVFMCSGFNDLAPEKAKLLNVLKLFEKPFDPKTMINDISGWLFKLR